MSDGRAMLFTAFEPSGDALASRIIARLKKERPNLRIAGMGGDRMRDAGCELLMHTTDKATMGTDSLSRVGEHRRWVATIRAWMQANELAVHVPTDSPAANWSMCKLTRTLHPNAKIVHLAAPQLWAWGAWRVRKLRKFTDRVLCLLPFEPDWFTKRGVPATFVSHPLFDPPPSLDPAHATLDDLPQDGAYKLALLPGSRPGEIKANWPTMLQAYRLMRKRMPDLRGVVAAASEQVAEQLRSLTPDDDKPPMPVHRIHDVLVWSDAALVVSGTATLHVAAYRVPMAAIYNLSRLQWMIGSRIVRTRTFTLPNLIGEHLGLGHVIKEFVPHFGQVAPVEQKMMTLLTDDQERSGQLVGFDRIHEAFTAVSFEEKCAEVLSGALKTN